MDIRKHFNNSSNCSERINLRQNAKIIAVTLLLLLTIGIFFSGCVGQKKEELVTVKVAYLPIISNGPIFIASDEGYFAEQGIKIEFVKFQSLGQATPPLIQGEIDVAGGAVTTGLFNAIAKGEKIKIVADKGHLGSECEYFGLLVRKDLYDNGTLRSIEQLKGKKIAVPSVGGLVDYQLAEMLAHGNLTLKDVEQVQMSFTTMVVALENNAIDAASISEPYLYQILESGRATKLISWNDILPNFPGNHLLFGPNLLEKNPELGKKFMVAYLKGVKQYNEGKTPRNVQILQNYTQLDKEILEKACWTSINQDGYFEKKAFMEIQDWLYENKAVDVKASEDQLFDMSFVEYANKELEKTAR